MKRENKSILDYLKAIAWVVVPFCLLGSLHYLFVFFPRTAFEKDNHILFNHLGFDYFGVVVGFFTLLVTLLVGWQIFSNIKERERFDKLTEANDKFKEDTSEICSKFDERITALDICCKEGRSRLIWLDNKIDSINNASMLVVSAQALIRSSKFENKESRTNSLLISIAYSSLWQALYQYISSKADKRTIMGCISQLNTCLMMLSIDEMKLTKEHYDTSLERYNQIQALDDEYKDPEVISALDEVKAIQEKISWDKEWEERRAAFARFEEQRDKIEAEGAARQSTEANGNPN